MSDALSFAEVDGQHAELLPARTVLSLLAPGHVDESGAAGGGAAYTGGAGGGAAYNGGDGGNGYGKAAFFNPVFFVKEGDVTNAITGGAGGTGGAGASMPAGGVPTGGGTAGS